MNILQVSSFLYPALAYGGTAKVVYDLSQELSKNHQVTVYTTDSFNNSRRLTEQEKLQSSESFTIRYFKNILNSWAYNLRFVTAFGMVWYFLWNHKSYDVVHIHDIYLFPQLMIAYLCLLFNKPLIYSPHGVLDPIRSEKRGLIKRLLWPSAKYVLAHSQEVVATSKKEKADLEQLGLNNVVVVPNGVAFEAVEASNKYSAFENTKKLVLLYIGKLHPQKGLVDLVESLTDFQDEYLLLLAGPDDGAKAQVEAIIKSNHLSNVEFLGFVDSAEKEELFKLADAFVYPSHTEGFSISILEALSHGLPAVVTKACNFPEVEQKRAGFVLNNQDLTGELVNTWKKLKNKKGQLTVMKQNAKELINRAYSIEKMAGRMTDIYEAA